MKQMIPLLTKLRARFAGRSLPPEINPIGFHSSNVDSLPYTLPNGIFKLFFVTTTSVAFGAYLAKEAAQFLRDNEIFVPKDEDDDDD